MKKNHQIEIRVRYSETDKMGVVYYGNYPQYLEVARVEWLRDLGVSYKEMEDKGIILPVLELNIKYKKSALYDELIRVEIQLKKMPSKTIEFDYEIYNEKDQLLTIAYTKLIFVDAKTMKPVCCPKYVLEKIKSNDF